MQFVCLMMNGSIQSTTNTYTQFYKSWIMIDGDSLKRQYENWDNIFSFICIQKRKWEVKRERKLNVIKQIVIQREIN